MKFPDYLFPLTPSPPPSHPSSVDLLCGAVHPATDAHQQRVPHHSGGLFLASGPGLSRRHHHCEWRGGGGCGGVEGEGGGGGGLRIAPTTMVGSVC